MIDRRLMLKGLFVSSFASTKEVGRSTGDTNAASIEALLAKSI